MSDADAIVIHADETSSMLDVIARAAKDPAVNVDKLERLLAIQERLLADHRRTAYFAALARLQANLPQIAKSGTITDRDGGVRNRYAKIEDIDVVIRPLCAAEGFSFSFDAKDGEYTCAMQHRDGHVETKSLKLPQDAGQGRNAVQSAGSTISYARRYLLSMHLNLITRDEDDDGNNARGVVSQQQAETLRAGLTETGVNEERFLRWAGAASIEEVPAAKYEGALRLIEEKRKAKR